MRLKVNRFSELCQLFALFKKSHHKSQHGVKQGNPLFSSLHIQGKQYWRFEGDVLDEDYPRDISVGFEGIPQDVDAAFAVPAPNHLGKEKAYFFKGICTGI